MAGRKDPRGVTLWSLGWPGGQGGTSPGSSRPRGQMLVTHTVSCAQEEGRRGDWPDGPCVERLEVDGGKDLASRTARAAGWEWCAEFGWVCPSCMTRLRAARAAWRRNG